MTIIFNNPVHTHRAAAMLQVRIPKKLPSAKPALSTKIY